MKRQKPEASEGALIHPSIALFKTPTSFEIPTESEGPPGAGFGSNCSFSKAGIGSASSLPIQAEHSTSKLYCNGNGGGWVRSEGENVEKGEGEGECGSEG